MVRVGSGCVYVWWWLGGAALARVWGHGAPAPVKCPHGGGGGERGCEAARNPVTHLNCAQGADVVFVMVGFPTDVREVILGPLGALSACGVCVCVRVCVYARACVCDVCACVWGWGGGDHSSAGVMRARLGAARAAPARRRCAPAAFSWT